jgi:hypothetical protein
MSSSHLSLLFVPSILICFIPFYMLPLTIVQTLRILPLIPVILFLIMKILCVVYTALLNERNVHISFDDSFFFSSKACAHADAAPYVTSIHPRQGLSNGGTSITVKGKHFGPTGPERVMIENRECEIFNFSTDSSGESTLVMLTPPANKETQMLMTFGLPVYYDVIVHTAGGGAGESLPKFCYVPGTCAIGSFLCPQLQCDGGHF